MLRLELSRLDLDASKPLRRSPPRPLEDRGPGYDEKFDFLTVLYDCFVAQDGRNIICIGPPLLNLEATVAPAIKRAFRKWLFPQFEVRHRERHVQMRLRPRALNARFASGLFEQQTIIAQPSHCRLFQGRRVLVTKSKDNELVWIRDWVHFHAINHGCDAVLIYDNHSTKYDAEDVYKVISAVPGVDVAVVVDWPFKYGPQAGPAGVWDSDFTQYAIMEHARLRFLATAEAVLNADIDELVMTDNRSSIFDLAKASRTGYLEYPGIMIENVSATYRSGARRHSDFAYSNSPPRQATRKWTVVPARCKAQSQWCVHQVTDMEPDQDVSAHVAHRHFAAINTGWKYVIAATVPPDQRHLLDKELSSAMQRCAGE